MPDIPFRFDGDASSVFRVGFLTDIHIGNASLRERQEAAIARMDSLGLRLLCLMGDIVDNGLEHNYALANRMLAKLDTPLLAITGNHEIFPLTLPLDVCLDNFRKGMGRPRHYGIRIFDPYLFVFLGIDKRMPHLPKTRRDTGLSDEQLDWFAQTLAANPDRPTVVISHAPFEQTVEDSQHFPLADSARLCEILATAPQVRLWLSGHTHLPDVHHGESLQTMVEPVPGRVFLHVPSVADYYVHVVNGVRQFFRGLPLESRLLECHPDHIDVQTINIESGEIWSMMRIPTVHRQIRAA